MQEDHIRQPISLSVLNIARPVRGGEELLFPSRTGYPTFLSRNID